MTKVAINGFGRIGRLAFRQMFEAEGYEVPPIVGTPIFFSPKGSMLGSRAVSEI